MLDKITNDLKQAMKNQDKFKLSVLRMLKSALQMESISLKKPLSDDEIITVIKRNVKQRKDSITEYQKFNKQEEIDNLNKEIEILSSYLPKQLTEEDLLKEVNNAFNELKPESMKDMGKLMKYLTDKIGNIADMSYVSKLVREQLNK